MRTLIFGLSVLLVAACGDDKNTSDSDTSTGGTGTASTSTGDTTGTTGGSSGDDGGTAPTTAGETEATDTGATGTTGSATTHTSHATTGDSSSSGDSSDDSGTDGESSGTSGGVDPAGTAIVENSCAPQDGPALQFKLEVTEPMCGAQGKGENLHIFLWQGGPLAPGIYPIEQDTGFASYQVGNNEPTNSVDGTLTIVSWIGDVVVGSYELTFVDDSVREGEFAGPFCMINAPCG